MLVKNITETVNVNGESGINGDKWIVTVRGCGLILSIIHLAPLTADSPFTFTVLVIFFADTFRYIVW